MALETPQPEFRQVAGLIRASIQSGEYPPGSVVPGEHELATRYKTTRATVNRAFAVLRAEGLIRSERGRGTTVNELPIIPSSRTKRQRRDFRESGESRGSFEAELNLLGLSSRSEVVVNEVPAPDDVAQILGVADGSPVLARAREMFANDILVMLATSYLPLEIAGGTELAQTQTGPGGLYSRLADMGYAPAEFTEEISVRPPTDEEARALRMDPDQRVLQIVRTATTGHGLVVEVNKMVKPAHQWKISYTWAAE